MKPQTAEILDSASISMAARYPIPLLDLKSQYAEIEDEIMQAIREVCTSQRFILGPQVAQLEQAIAAYAQCAHGIGVSSGTDALLVALMALEIGAGDEVNRRLLRVSRKKLRLRRPCRVIRRRRRAADIVADKREKGVEIAGRVEPRRRAVAAG